MIKRFFARFGVLCIVAAVIVPISAGPARADVSIDGAGSTWSQIALDQWRADVARQGIAVNYQGVGSTSGRVFYYQDQIDFAASEIPFTPAYRDATGSVITNEVALAAHRPYAYMPDVAGGTSFMYHLDINGKLVTNLRLTPTVIAKIFTGVIKNWNDPTIANDNPQLQLPNLPIRPIVRSDGSGTTAQFTAFMASQTPDIWNAFCQRVGLNVNPCPSVSLWPDINAVAQQFSDGVADYVAAPYNNGAITYVEYGYAKQRGFPVASVLNKAGYFTQPTPNAVAIALQGATLNADLTQNLQGVYNNTDSARVSGVELQLPDRADDDREAVHRGEGHDAQQVHPLHGVRGSRRPPSSAIHHSRRTSSRPRSTWCGRSRATSTRHRSISATTRRSRGGLREKRDPPSPLFPLKKDPLPSDVPTVTAPPSGNEVQTGQVTPVTSATTPVAVNSKGVKRKAAGAVS